MCRFVARAPFVVYEDFESILEPTGQDHPVHGHKTYDYQHHIPCAVGYKVISHFPELSEPYNYHGGEDCVKRFIERLQEFEQKAIAPYFDEEELKWDSVYAAQFNMSWTCHICKKPIDRDRPKDKVYHFLYLFPSLHTEYELVFSPQT